MHIDHRKQPGIHQSPSSPPQSHTSVAASHLPLPRARARARTSDSRPARACHWNRHANTPIAASSSSSSPPPPPHHCRPSQPTHHTPAKGRENETEKESREGENRHLLSRPNTYAPRMRTHPSAPPPPPSRYTPSLPTGVEIRPLLRLLRVRIFSWSCDTLLFYQPNRPSHTPIGYVGNLGLHQCPNLSLIIRLIDPAPPPRQSYPPGRPRPLSPLSAFIPPPAPAWRLSFPAPPLRHRLFTLIYLHRTPRHTHIPHPDPRRSRCPYTPVCHSHPCMLARCLYTRGDTFAALTAHHIYLQRLRPCTLPVAASECLNYLCRPATTQSCPHIPTPRHYPKPPLLLTHYPRLP